MRRKRSSRGSAPVAFADDALDGRRAVCLDLARFAHLGERLEVRLDTRDLRHRGADRRLELLGDRMRLLERQFARQLDVQRELGAAVDVDEREVVHLAHLPHGERGRVRTLAQVGGSCERLDVHDDVASGSARSTAASTASAAACPWPTAAPGETPITTSANWRPAGLPHAQPPQLDGRLQRRRSPSARRPRPRPARDPSARRR